MNTSLSSICRVRRTQEESKNAIRCLGRLAQYFRLYRSSLCPSFPLSLSHSLGHPRARSAVPGRSGSKTSSAQASKVGDALPSGAAAHPTFGRISSFCNGLVVTARNLKTQNDNILRCKSLRPSCGEGQKAVISISDLMYK